MPQNFADNYIPKLRLSEIVVESTVAYSRAGSKRW